MEPSGALGKLLVVELGWSPAGSYCARLFGGYGAEVVAVGPGPTGPGAAFHNQARSRVPADSPEATAALARADVIIHAAADGPLPAHPLPDRVDLPGIWDEPIEVRLSPFGDSGPYADWRASDLVETALAGHLRLTGDPDAAPLQGVADLGRHAAGTAAFIGALGALVARRRTGRAQTVEVTHLEVLAALHQFTLCRHTHNGSVLQRLGNRYAGPGAIIGAYRCRDGWVGLALPTEDMVERMLEVTGLTSLLERPDVGSVIDLMVDIELLNEALVPVLETQDRAELVELWQALRLPIAPIATVEEVLDDEHLADRRFWDTMSWTAGGGVERTVRVPGPPFRLSRHPWTPEPSVRRGSTEAGDEPVDDLRDGPLTGLRVLDLTRVWAGPLAARILADLGAEVLCIEGPAARGPTDVSAGYVEATRYFPDNEPGPDPWNRMAFHNKYAINKRSAALDLSRPEGRDLFRRLVPTADVVIENYSPRVMPGFGFDEEALRRLNPDLVVVTMPGYGRSGPNTDWVAYGPTIDGHAGHTALMGYRGGGPWKCGIAWPDPIGGLHAAAGALVALLDRLDDPTAGGQTVEVAQFESAVNMVGQHLVAAQLDGPPAPPGNRRAGLVPQGVYPCLGTDRWIALSIASDDQWVAACRVLGLDDLAELDGPARADGHDVIDERIAERTRARVDRELMVALQAAGVAAAMVADAADVLADPHLDADGFFVALDHPSAGTHRWPRLPIRFSATPTALRGPAPRMGADNEYAACELAGLSAAQYQELVDQAILSTRPPD